MKTTLKRTAISLILVLMALPLFSWNGRIHATIAHIAENHMTPKAKKAVSEILDGRSIIYYASWLDQYRQEMLIEYTTEEGKIKRGTIPHVIKVGLDGKIIVKDNTEGISIINKSIENLKDYKNVDDSTRIASLQCIIHLVGDMHCPGHVRYADYDKNSAYKKYDKTKVVYKKKITTMHNIWDSKVVDELTPGGVGDLAYLIDRLSKKEIKEIQKGTPEEWGQEIADDSKHLWYICDGDKITKKYFLENRDFAYRQIEKAGLRLAKVLNDLFK